MIRTGRGVAALVAGLLMLSACIRSSPPATTAPTPTTQPAVTAPPTTSDAPNTTTTRPQLSAELEAQIDSLIAATELLRGLEFLEHPAVVVLTGDQLAQRVREVIEEELDPVEVARDEALMKLLGIADPDLDLGQLYSDLYSEIVIGFYDPDEGELVIPATEEALDAAERTTLVHELTHALTDQHFQFGDLTDILDEEQRFEEAAALQALVEGDATWVEVLYFQSLSADEQREVLSGASSDLSVFNSSPPFLQDLLIFPYIAGGGFVAELFISSGDFEAIDSAYLDPPQTTEQIIHPDLFFGGESAVSVELPDTTVAGYEIGEESSWGEEALQAMFDQALSGRTATDAAEGWGGDRYRILWDGEHVAFVLLYVGDAVSDAEEIEAALTEFVAAEMSGTADYTFVGRSGDMVLFIAADQSEAGEAIRQAFTDF